MLSKHVHITKTIQNVTKCHGNVTFFKGHGLWRFFFYVVSFMFFVDISESIHSIFTGLQNKWKHTKISASIGTSFDKIRKCAFVRTRTSPSGDTNGKYYQLESEKITSVIKWEITLVTKWENSTGYKVRREFKPLYRRRTSTLASASAPRL